MALKIRLFQLKSKNLKGKWYGRAISNREVHTEEMAKNICYRTTLTEADVHAAVRALITEMTNQLQDGNTVVLDGFGRFHLTVQSDIVDNPKDYNLKYHIRRILCKFTPAGCRNPFDRHLERPFTDGVDLHRV